MRLIKKKNLPLFRGTLIFRRGNRGTSVFRGVSLNTGYGM
jgi:hypothetical protein